MSGKNTVARPRSVQSLPRAARASIGVAAPPRLHRHLAAAAISDCQPEVHSHSKVLLCVDPFCRLILLSSAPPSTIFQLTSELASIILEPRPPPPVEWAQTTELPNPGLRMPTAARRDATEASGSSRREVDGQSSKEGQPRPQGGESRGDKGGKPRVRRPQQLWKSPRKLAEWRRQQLTQRQEQGFIPEDGID